VIEVNEKSGWVKSWGGGLGLGECGWVGEVTNEEGLDFKWVS